MSINYDNKGIAKLNKFFVIMNAIYSLLLISKSFVVLHSFKLWINILTKETKNL
jgi:hypothetical protein